MQHFLYENNLDTQVECQLIGLLQSDNTLPNLIHTDPQLLKFYQEHQNELQHTGDWLYYQGIQTPASILLNLGPQDKLQAELLKQQLLKIMQMVKTKPWQSLAISLPQLKNFSADEQIKLIILTLESTCYQFLPYKTETKRYSLNTVYHQTQASLSAIQEAQAIQQGLTLCQNLANMPANDCTPIELELAAKKLAKEFPTIHCSALNEKDLQKLGMHSFLSVAKGSDNPPRLVELHYKSNKQQQPIVLIGKGITFDTGGINLKPSEGMYEMKYDMSGAATVLGVMKAIALLDLPLYVVGILACAENMPSAHATRPGDIVKSMQGITIEITNTDAEGRLVLADAMTYAQQYHPQIMIDIATLTGAVIVALGHVYTGLMTPHDQLAQKLMVAGQKTLDKIWRLPLDIEYEDSLKSPVADTMNSHNSREAGSIVAAHFLKKFTQDCTWAHLDIAGTAWISGAQRQATGRPVHLLVEWLQHLQ